LTAELCPDPLERHPACYKHVDATAANMLTVALFRFITNIQL